MSLISLILSRRDNALDSCRLTALAPPAMGHRAGNTGVDGSAGIGVDRVDRLLRAALTAAHPAAVAAGGALVVAWERTVTEAPIQVSLGGTVATALTSPGDLSRTRLLYPPGTRVERVEGKHLYRRWNSVPVWVRCTGRADTDLVPAAGPPQTRPLLDAWEDLVTHLPAPWVLLVVAEPIRELADDIAATDHARARAQRDRLWRVHVLVGGGDPDTTRTNAGILCAAADIDGLPYALAPAVETDRLPRTWAAMIDGTAGSPFVASGEAAAALARPPRRELPGLPMLGTARFGPAPCCRAGAPHVRLGAVADESGTPVEDFVIELTSLNRHTLVAGATGSGKSHTVRHLLEALHSERVPWWVIEPAKAEYARMAGRIGAPVRVIRPGDPDAVAWGLNPLEPEPGFPLQTHIDLVRELFLAAFDAVEPFPQILAHALDRAYTDMGWDTVLGENLHRGAGRYPDLAALQIAANAVVDDIGYGREVRDNVRGFVDVRLRSLCTGTPGQFFTGGHRLDIAELIGQHVVFELESVGADADRAFVIGVVLIRLVEYLRVHRATTGPERLRHVLVVEEAHRLLRIAAPGSAAARAVERFVSMLAEIRAYGEGIVIAEQIPTKITPDAIQNTAVKITHRLPGGEDRAVLGAAMGLDPAQSHHLTALPPGVALVSTDTTTVPALVAVPLGAAREYAAPAATAHPDHALTLRETRRARRIADDPRCALWLELLLLAHLCGRAAFRPASTWRDQLAANHAPRLLHAAINDYLDTAITARYGGLAAYYPPEDLHAHLTTTAAHHLDGQPGCTGPETHWQAGRYRWIDIHLALTRADLDPDRPHPDTAAWKTRGLDLPGATIAEQKHAYGLHLDHITSAREIVTGPSTPPTVHTLVDRLSTPRSPLEQRLAQAVTHLTGSHRWPIALLDQHSAPQTDPVPAPPPSDTRVRDLPAHPGPLVAVE
ncbi:ATP-binding protein [Nocardia takedensis]